MIATRGKPPNVRVEAISALSDNDSHEGQTP